MQIVKPLHKHYMFCKLDEETYCSYASKYSKAKRFGIRGIYIWATGIGIKEVVIEISKQQLRTWGRQKLGTVIISCAAHVCAPAVKLVTNSTKILKVAKSVHTFTSFCFECVEDSSNLSTLPIDLVLFGQPIPVGDTGRFNLMGDDIDFLN